MVATLGGFASLYIHEEATSPAHHIHTQMDAVQMMDSHLRGMWIAFAIAAVFIVFFVQRVSRALAARERELQQARALVERREKLASLATLAAGAAHELSTPLSTIAVVAKELQRSLPQDVPADVAAISSSCASRSGAAATSSIACRRTPARTRGSRSRR